MVATEPYIGLKSTHEALFFIITGPVGAYYPEGFNPVKITVSDQYSRAGPGGLGSAKTAANYAASLKAEKEALARGFTQVLWLDAAERRFIEEVGSMNILFKIGGAVVTPPVGETILAGLTKDSVLKLLGQWGVPVEERPITIDEVVAAHEDGSLEEVFGGGYRRGHLPRRLARLQGPDAPCRERRYRPVRGTALRRADRHPVRNPAGRLRVDSRGGADRHERLSGGKRLSGSRTEVPGPPSHRCHAGEPQDYSSGTSSVSSRPASRRALGTSDEYRMYSSWVWAPSPQGPRPSSVGRPRAPVKLPSLPPPNRTGTGRKREGEFSRRVP